MMTIIMCNTCMCNSGREEGRKEGRKGGREGGGWRMGGWRGGGGREESYQVMLAQSLHCIDFIIMLHPNLKQNMVTLHHDAVITNMSMSSGAPGVMEWFGQYCNV